jgi:hypothetical protein
LKETARVSLPPTLFKKHMKKEFIHDDDKLNKAIEKAIEKKEIKEVENWLKAWTKEDKKEMERWEKELRKIHLSDEFD